MTHPCSLAARRLTALAGLFVTLAATPAGAAPGPAAVPWFFDGERRVEVERIAEPARLGDGVVRHAPPRAGVPVGSDARHGAGALTPVRLRYAGRARDVHAFVDATAIVQLDPGAEEQLAALGARLVRPLMPSIGLYLVEDTTGGDGIDVAQRLQPFRGAHAGIRQATPNLFLARKTYGDFTPDDPRFPGQWFWKNLQMTKAWGLTLGDAKTTIVVVDTGCDLTHPDLVDKLDPGLDPVDGDDDPSPHVDENGAAHGTSCAGLVAASTNNGVGIAGGCPGCRLRCVRLITGAAIPISADVEAFQFALDTGAAVVSNSWGFVEAVPVPKQLEDAINNVFDNGRGGLGALVLFAMGNDDREVGDDEMQAVRGVLGIGAINNLDAQTPFTNSGNSVDLVAPTGTLTTDIAGAAGEDPSDYTNLFGGTSSSCPVAAGIAGLLVSAAPERTSAELYDILIETARLDPYAVPDANGHDLVFGYGIINPVKALEKVLDPGSGGSGGSGGGGAGTTTGNGGAGGSTTEENSGCACDVAGAPSGAGGALVYFAGLALAVARARRRRR